MMGRFNPRYPRIFTSVGICVLAILALAPPCLGAAGTVLERTNELKLATELAMFVAKSALLSPNQTDLEVHALELIDLLEGPSEAPPSGAGMIEVAESIDADLKAMERDGSASLEAVTSSTFIVSFLSQALEHARQVLESSAGDAVNAMESAYANLLSAYGLDESQFSVPGIRSLPSLLPNVSVVVGIGESIQEAIDRVLPGGTVYLAAGTHVLDSYIGIYKSLSLQPLSDGDGVVVLRSTGTTTWNFGISIGASESGTPFTVSISSLEIIGAGNGISVDAPEASVDLQDLSIHGCSRAGISVSAGSVRIVGCAIRENASYGIALNGTADVDLVRTAIIGNGTRAAQAASTLATGAYVVDAAKLSMSAATIQSNYGPGILVQDEAGLVLTSSLVSDNRGSGLLASDATTLHIAGTGFLRNDGAGIHFHSPACPIEVPLFVGLEFTGRVTGSSNRSFDADAADGNLSGGICPSGYEGLLRSSL